jgi:hypothetical protein
MLQIDTQVNGRWTVNTLHQRVEDEEKREERMRRE